MIAKMFCALLLLAVSLQGAAQQVDIAALGSLQLAYRQIEAVTLYPAPQLAARAGFRGGDAFSLLAPGRVQQIEYLVTVGHQVAAGQPFATLRGPEMHHLQLEYKASGEMLEVARRRYSSNKALYARKAIREDQWVQVSEQYFSAQLEYEHLRHFYELVLDTPGASGEPVDSDALTLVAPSAGILDYDGSRRTIAAGERIASFIPPQAVRLEVSLPNAMREQVAYLDTGKCRLAVEQIGAITQGFFVSAWTQPLTTECDLIPGQQLMVTPLLRTAAYRVPRAAVFQWDKGSYLLVKEQQVLSPVAVSLLGSQGEDYILESDAALAGKDVLVSSVSAVQGVLMGLGGE